MSGAKRYDAFITYQNRPFDEKAAARLQKLLEEVRPPAGGKRRLDVFCGRGRRTSSDLGGDVLEALRSSEFLIVVCSPGLFASSRCMAEIEYFLSLHGGLGEKILTVLIGGTPGESVPEVILPGLYSARGPVTANIAAKSETGSLKRLKTEYLRIAAPILGCSFEDLVMRNSRRSAKKTAVNAAAGILLLAGVFGLLSAGMHMESRARLSAQADRFSRAQSLLIESRRQLKEGDRAQAIRLALAAAAGEEGLSPAAYGPLFSALYAGGYSQTLLRHAEAIAAECYSPDGRLAATASGQYVYLWDARSGELVHIFSGFESDPRALVFSSDGKTLATASEYGEVILFDAASKTRLFAWGLELTPSPELCFSAGDREIFLWHDLGGSRLDIVSGGQSELLDAGERYVLALKSGPKAGYFLFQGADEYILRDENMNPDMRYKTGHQGESGETGVFVSPDGERLLFCRDAAAQLWDTAGGSMISSVGRGQEYGFITGCILPDGGVALSCGDNAVRIYGEELGDPRQTLYGHAGLVRVLCAQSGGEILAAGSDDGDVKLWNVTSGALLGEVRTLDSAVARMALSPDGGYFLAVSRGNLVQVCRFDDMDAAAYLKTASPPAGARFDEEGNPVLACYEEDTLKAYTFTLEGESSGSGETDFEGSGPDGRFGIGEDGMSLSFRKSGLEVKADALILSAAVGPDEKTVAAALESGLIVVWDAGSRQISARFHGPLYPAFDIAYTPDGSMLYGTSLDGTVTFWDPATGAELCAIPGMGDLYYPVDFQIENGALYSVRTGKTYELSELPNRIAQVYPARVRADGKYLLVPAPGGAFLYEIDLAAMVETARNRQG